MVSIDPDLDLHRSLWNGTTTVYMAPYDWNGMKGPARPSFVRKLRPECVLGMFFEGVNRDD